MSIDRRLSSALLCAITLCLTSSLYAQTVNYGTPTSDRVDSEAIKNLLEIESKLEAVLNLLPKTISGKEALEKTLVLKQTLCTTPWLMLLKKAEANDASDVVQAPKLEEQFLEALVATKREQAKQESPVGRYQISCWVLPPPSGKGNSTEGAFIIDTQTGMVWKVVGVPHRRKSAAFQNSSDDSVCSQPATNHSLRFFSFGKACFAPVKTRSTLA